MNKKTVNRARFILPALLFTAGAVLAQPAPEAASATATTAASAPFTTDDARQGTFNTVRGDVTHTHGNTPGAARVGGPVWEGDRVVSGPQSAAAITLRDGSILSIGPNSSVDLAQYQFDATTHEGNVLFALARGSLRLVTGLIAKLRPEQVKVSTPTTVIGVRGTDFIVEYQP